MTKEEHIKQWIDKANEDLLVVQKLTEFDIVATSAVCFHCQQAAEKHLKAFLIYHDIEIKRTHSIEYLLAECGEIDIVFDNIEPKNLSDFGVAIRYPGESYSPSDSEVLEYSSIAKKIKDIVEEKINFTN